MSCFFCKQAYFPPLFLCSCYLPPPSSLTLSFLFFPPSFPPFSTPPLFLWDSSSWPGTYRDLCDLCLMSTEIKSVEHHTWLTLAILKCEVYGSENFRCNLLLTWYQLHWSHYEMYMYTQQHVKKYGFSISSISFHSDLSFVVRENES